MSESVLKALLRLFAIIANVEAGGISPASRSVVRYFLGLHLKEDLLEDYLLLFDDYVFQHHRKERQEGVLNKIDVSNSVKVVIICKKISTELNLRQKLFVIIQLLSFLKYSKGLSNKELEFIDSVADIFRIKLSDYKNIQHFVFNGDLEFADKNALLIIADEQTILQQEFKYIIAPQLEGKIIVLKIESSPIYAFRYFGEETIYINGQLLIPDKVYLINRGASIRNTKINPIYYSDIVEQFTHADRGEHFVFDAKKISYNFSNGVKGLHPFSLNETSGKIIGIIGNSGTGKSTFVNVLNGNMSPLAGMVSINGFDIYDKKNKIKGLIGYIPQDDLLIEELTVFQNLYYSAKLCYKEYRPQQINKVVVKLLYNLGLYEVKDLKVGSALNKMISGGQRKRLNIALELVREPSILFVDEPTSGLSSTDSDMVIDILKELALKGKLIFVVIHQPSSEIYKLFDKVVYLDKGGYVIYQGYPLEAITYFKKLSGHINVNDSECGQCGNVSPEQVLQMIEAKTIDEFGNTTHQRKISPRNWYRNYQTLIEEKHADFVFVDRLPKINLDIPNRLRQFKIFFTRDLLSKLTNKQYLLLNLLEAPFLAFILAFLTRYTDKGVLTNTYLFSENRNLPAYLFMAIVVSLFIGLTVSAEEIFKDRKVRQRESFIKLSRLSYFTAKVVEMFCLSLLQSFLFVLVGNYLLGIRGMFIDYWLVLFSVFCFANLMGLTISSALNSAVTIYILIPLLLVPQLLLSGVIVNFDKLNKIISSDEYVPAIGDIMVSRWAYEALIVNQFQNNEFEKKFYDSDFEMSQSSFKNNYLIPHLLSINEYCKKNASKPEEVKSVANYIHLLKIAIIRLDYDTRTKPLENINTLTGSYTPTLADAIQQHLIIEQQYYIKQFNLSSANHDKVFENLIQELGSVDEIELLRQNYQNKAVADLVQNKNDLNKLIETDYQLVQVADPIFLIPSANNGRAQFYAPIKKIRNTVFSTFWFNLMVIWGMTFILYVLLLFEALKKIIHFFGKHF